jgi:general secretion pathway protein F
MTTFEYKGFDHSGRISRGMIEALDIKEAREKLSAMGILPEKVAPAGNSRSARRGMLNRHFGMEVRAMLYRELGSLIRAGLPLTQALDVLIQAPELGEHRASLAGIRDRVREGSTFAAALASASKKVSPFEQAVVEVGERAGTLEEILERLATFMEEQVRVAERVQTAMIYPMIVLVLAVVIVVVLLGVMVPAMGRMLSESHIPLPFLTRVMMFGGQWVLPLFLPVLALGVIWVVMLRKRMAQNPQVREDWEKKWFGIPLVGRAYAFLVNLRFARTLALLLRGGVPLVEGMSLAGRSTGNAWIHRLSVEQAEQVRHGTNLSEAVRRMGPLGASLPGWIRAGEASGKLDSLLDNAADRYQQQWDKMISRMLSVLEPALIIIVGGFVLAISLSILMPVLQLNKTLM